MKPCYYHEISLQRLLRKNLCAIFRMDATNAAVNLVFENACNIIVYSFLAVNNTTGVSTLTASIVLIRVLFY